MDKIHRPAFIDVRRVFSIIAELRLHAPLWRLVAQLQAHFMIKSINALGVYRPSFATQKHVDASIAVSHARFRDFLDPFFEIGLLVAPGLYCWVERGAFMTRQARRSLTFHTAVISETSSRRRAGLKAFGV